MYGSEGVATRHLADRHDPGGELPEPESNGIAYLKIPLNRLGATP